MRNQEFGAGKGMTKCVSNDVFIAFFCNINDHNLIDDDLSGLVSDEICVRCNTHVVLQIGIPRVVADHVNIDIHYRFSRWLARI